MRWTAISTSEMITDSRIVRRERFLADMTTRRATVCLHCCLDNVCMDTLADTIFFMRQIIELLRKSRYTHFITTEVIRRLYVVVLLPSR